MDKDDSAGFPPLLNQQPLHQPITFSRAQQKKRDIENKAVFMG
jgi:hypothetical protein